MALGYVVTCSNGDCYTVELGALESFIQAHKEPVRVTIVYREPEPHESKYQAGMPC